MQTYICIILRCACQKKKNTKQINKQNFQNYLPMKTCHLFRIIKICVNHTSQGSLVAGQLSRVVSFTSYEVVTKSALSRDGILAITAGWTEGLKKFTDTLS